MKSRALLTGLLIALVVLSGCNSIANPIEPETENTPVKSPESSNQLQEITKNGTIDPGAVIRSHNDALGNSSHTVHLTHHEHYADGSLRILVTESTFRGTENGHYYLDYRADEPAVSLANKSGVWYQEWAKRGEVASALRLNTTASTQYSTRSSPVIRTQYSDLDNVYVLLSHLNTSVTTFEQDGKVNYLIHAEATNASTDLGALADQLSTEEVRDVRDVEFTLVLNQNGAIDHYSMEYTIQSNEGSIHLLETAHYTNINETQVPKPDWASETIDSR